MWPFRKNKFKNLKREEVVDAIYELEKQEKLVEDSILEKQEEVEHLLQKGRVEKGEELKMLYAKKISHLKQEMKTEISKGSYLLYNIKLLKKLKDAIDDKSFFMETSKVSLGSLLKDQKGLAKFLNQALNIKILAEDVLSTADETFNEVQAAYEPSKEIYGVDANEDEILSVFDEFGEEPIKTAIPVKEEKKQMLSESIED